MQFAANLLITSLDNQLDEIIKYISNNITGIIKHHMKNYSVQCASIYLTLF